MKDEIVEIEEAISLPKSLSEAASQSSGSSIVGAAVVAESLGGRIGRYRWVICGLLFFATTINYVDRQVLGLLKETIQRDLRWSEIDYSNVAFAFTTAYAIGLLLVGRLMDWLGTRKGFSFAIMFWSLAAMAHASFNGFVHSLFGVSFDADKAWFWVGDYGVLTLVPYGFLVAWLYRSRRVEAAFAGRAAVQPALTSVKPN